MFKEIKSIINTNKIKKDVKLIVFSDIHYTGIKDNKVLDKIYNILKDKDIDYICIPGDLIDSPYVIDKNYFTNWIKKLGSLSKVIISLGNHDIRSKEKDFSSYYDEAFFNGLSKINNVYLLNNKSIEFNDIYFYGYTQSYNYYYLYKSENAHTMIKELNKYNITSNLPNKYKILLMHSPICIGNKVINKKLKKYDLILCGHMHNGVVPPILDELFDNNRGIVSPNKSLLPKYARGIINDNNITIISSGITKIPRSHFLHFLNIFFPISYNYIIISNKCDYKKEAKYYF